MTNNKTSKRIFIITGAANGISKQIAKDLDINNNILCLFDKDSEVIKMKKYFTKAVIFAKCGDVSSEYEVNSFVAEVIKNFKTVDVLINGAAIVPYSEVFDTDWKLFKNTLEINLGGYFLFSKATANVMKINKKGSIINISSISSYVGIPGQSAYASSKGGISALTRVLASELGPFGIKVNAIAPGSILVDRNRKKMLTKWSEDELTLNIPLGRFGTPKDISGVVQFLISEWADYVHGAVITVDGGMTIRGK